MECDKDICPIIWLLNFLGKKWNLPIVKTINEWADTFTGIKEILVSINPKILAQRLDELEKNGFIERKIISEKPVKIRYYLTEKSKDLSLKIKDLENWIKKWN